MGSEEFSHFCSFFFAFLRFFRFSSLFFAFLRFLLEQGQTTAIYWGNGEFHSDPVCTDPVRNFPTLCGILIDFWTQAPNWGHKCWEPVGQLYRIENSPNPKIDQKYHADIRTLHATRDRKNTLKIPEKYWKKYPVFANTSLINSK